MWPFRKKDAFDLNSLEKELSTGSSSSSGFQGTDSNSLPGALHQNMDSEDDDGGFAKTTKQDRHEMAKSFSNTDDSFLAPSNHVPVTNNPSVSEMNASFGQSSYGSSFDSNQFNDRGVQNQNSGGTGSLSVSPDKIAHKMEVMERQIEILSSKVDLLKVNIETINSKISNIDQKIDKKLNNSWM